MKMLKHLAYGGLVQLIIVFGLISAVGAQSSSSSYSVNEYFFGTGGINESLTSSNYSARASIGEMTVGNVTGTAYQAYGGFETTDKPFLEASVTTTNVDVGTLSNLSPSTGTATFEVRTYLASGYVVTTEGLPTSENGDTIAPMTTAGSSVAGTEQFGINLVANTSPTAFGADPVNTSISFGDAATGYDTDGVFKYNEGDTIAYSNSSSGITQYTISYLYNIGAVTEAGTYVLHHTLIVTSTY